MHCATSCDSCSTTTRRSCVRNAVCYARNYILIVYVRLQRGDRCGLHSDCIRSTTTRRSLRSELHSDRITTRRSLCSQRRLLCSELHSDRYVRLQRGDRCRGLLCSELHSDRILDYNAAIVAFGTTPDYYPRVVARYSSLIISSHRSALANDEQSTSAFGREIIPRPPDSSPGERLSSTRPWCEMKVVVMSVAWCGGAIGLQV